MKITFIGAAHEVTGSCTQIELDGRYYLVDFGMEQGPDTFDNVRLPIAPKEVEAVFLTHAHIDHSGLLPKLYKDGFRGKIYATENTYRLCDIMLRDSAHIQMAEAEWKNKKAERAGGAKLEPIYDMDDAVGVLGLFETCAYDTPYEAAPGLVFQMTEIGHLLGAACIGLQLTENGITKKIVFSGDVGNTGQPIVKDPRTVAETDYLVIESTYGNRLHAPPEDTVKELARHIQRTFDRRGSVIIPAFAVGRTQELLFALREIKQKKLVTGHDGFPVYMDSPLAERATAIFMECEGDCFDEETTALLAQGVNPIWFDDIILSLTPDDSKRINADPRPKIIISASGMCDAGRIRHHLKHNLWKRENLILFAGYQAEGSPGRRLLEGAEMIRLFGEPIAVRAEIAALHGTSGHADRDGLVKWLEGFRQKPTLVFVNHGSEQSCEDFKDHLIELGYRAQAPYSGAEFDPAAGTMTVIAEGKRIVKADQKKEAAEKPAYNALMETAEELMAMAKEPQGRSNKELEKLAGQIRRLIDRWE